MDRDTADLLLRMVAANDERMGWLMVAVAKIAQAQKVKMPPFPLPEEVE